MSSVDDLILAGALSVIAAYTAALIVVIASVLAFMEIFSAAAAGDYGEVTILVLTCMFLLSVYICTGLWLQKCGRI